MTRSTLRRPSPLPETTLLAARAEAALRDTRTSPRIEDRNSTDFRLRQAAADRQTENSPTGGSLQPLPEPDRVSWRVPADPPLPRRASIR